MQKMHIPILLGEVLQSFEPIEGKTFADMTFGEAGHTEALLDRKAAEVVGVDQDRQTLDRYLQAGRLRADPRLHLLHGRMSDFSSADTQGRFDGILADLGVSTRQLLTPERGFSFSQAGPLDMRMDADSDMTLADYLATVEEEDLANGLWRTVEMQGSRSTARRIIEAQRAGKLKTTLDLAACMRPRPGKTHPATVLFLGLRMLINREWEEVAEGVPALFECLKPGGRLSVISFHSTEDRLVKRAFARLAGRCVCTEKICRCPREERGKLITTKPILPSEQELRDNPRSRSAKLRVIERN